MARLDRTFGIAVPNFTAYPQMPDVKALVDYGVRMEQLGFDSLWVGITFCSASSRIFRSSNP